MVKFRSDNSRSAPGFEIFWDGTTIGKINSFTNFEDLLEFDCGYNLISSNQVTYLNYYLGCGGELTSSTGAFTSPNYPQAYHHNAECTWKISVAKGSRIQLIFVDINLESSASCR